MSKKPVCVIIDPAHGANVQGKRSPYSLNKVQPELPFEEYIWSREICMMIAEKLKNLDIDVTFTTVSDDEPGLLARMLVTESHVRNHDAHHIFVSVHVNAAGMGDKWTNARGFSVYTTPGQNNSDKLATRMYECMEYELKGTDFRFRKDMQDGDVDYEANFYVIRKAPCPAVLTENGFMDNIEDVKLLDNPEIKNRIAEAHVKAICRFITDMGW